MGVQITQAAARGSKVIDLGRIGISTTQSGKANRQAIEAVLSTVAAQDPQERQSIYLPSGVYTLDRGLFLNGNLFNRLAAQ